MTLAEFLEKRKMTQVEFAALAGIDQSAVSRYLKGDRTPRLEIVLKIAKATRGRVRPEDWSAPKLDEVA